MGVGDLVKGAASQAVGAVGGAASVAVSAAAGMTHTVSRQVVPVSEDMIARGSVALGSASSVAKSAGGAAIGAANSVAKSAGSAAIGVASSAADMAGDAAGAAVGAAGGAAGAVAGAAGGVAGAAGGAAVALAEGVKETAMFQKERLSNLAGHFRELLENYCKRKVQNVLEVLVAKIPGIIKNATDDADMPSRVKRGKDSLIDSLWPDIRQEIMWEIAVAIDGEEDDGMKEPYEGCTCCYSWLRYHLYPYNKGIWGQLKDPVWIIFTLISLIPIWGLSAAIFLLIFILIDKSDEYQLVSFILQFKGVQFLTQGVIRAVLGFFLYLQCATAPANEDQHSCENDGPGSTSPMATVLAAYGIQLVLCWVAFALLPCSEKKGISQLKGLDFETTGSVKTRGGYIIYLLWYDLFWFLVSAGALVYVIYLRRWVYDDWPVKHAFFAIQMVYGLLTMPFFLFTLPLLRNALTHTAPTGYDEYGRCRKYQAPPMPEQQKEEKKGSIFPSSLLSKEEAERVLGRLTRMITGGQVDSLDDDAETGGHGPTRVGKTE